MQNTCIYEISNSHREVSFDGSLPTSARTPTAVTGKILIDPRLCLGHRQGVTVNAVKKNENGLDKHVCFDNTDMIKILKKNQRNACKCSNLPPDMLGLFSIYYFTYVNYNKKEVLHIIGILRGYAIRSCRRPEGSQQPQGRPSIDWQSVIAVRSCCQGVVGCLAHVRAYSVKQ